MKLFLLVLVFSLFEAAKEKPKPIDPNAQHVRFSADISRLMQLIVNSLYSNKEIFLRELISNCADAMNKVKMEAQTNPAILLGEDESKLEIKIIPDEDAETLTIIDNGIGMDKDELMTNLGTIAHSGTLKFFESVANGTVENDLIGQFGVGFYSSFLVAHRVEVTSRRYNSSQNIWTSIDAKSFTIQEDKSGEDLHRGTKVKLFLKEPKYGNSSIIHSLIEKYSSFIDFPIYLREEKEDKYSYERRIRLEERLRKENDPDALKETEVFEEEETEEDDDDFIPEPTFEFIHVNEQLPIWVRDPESDKDEDYISYTEYDDFFHAITYNKYKPEAPLGKIHYHSGKKPGEVKFQTLLFIPPRVPPGRNRNAVTRVTRLRLYVKKVLVTEEMVDMLPNYLTFVRGVLEIEDLRDPLFESASTSKGKSEKEIREKKKKKGENPAEDDDSILLNVSREMLQKSESLKVIAKRLTRLIVEYLVSVSDKARKDESDEAVEAYDTFYREYARDVKQGIHRDDDNRKEVAKLLRYNSSLHPEKLISLDDYIEEAAEKIRREEEQEKNNQELANENRRRGKRRDSPDHCPILYYAVDTEDIDKAMSFVRESPFLQPFIVDNRDVILLFDPYDEAILLRIRVFQGHPIVSVQEELRNRARDFEERGSMKKRFDQWRKDLQSLVTWMCSVLAGKVDRVEVSTKLAMGDFDKALEHEKERRMDEAERERLKEKMKQEKERYARRRKKVKVKKEDDNGVVIAGQQEMEEEEKENRWRRKHPSLLYKLKREREEAEKEGRTLDVLRDRVSLKKSVPCAVVSAEGALSSGLNRLYYNHPDATEDMKRRMSGKIFEINPVSPLIQRFNKAYKAIQARRAEEMERDAAAAAAGNTTKASETKNEEEEEDDEMEEEGQQSTAHEMKKLEKLLLTMYETAMLHDGYQVDEKIKYSQRLYNILSTMIGLPYAPVLPDEINEDFDDWLKKEMEEERQIRELEKEEKKKKHKEAVQKRLEEEGVEFLSKRNQDVTKMTPEQRKKYEKKLRKFEKRKKQLEERKKELEEKNKRPDESYFEDEDEDEDPEDVLNRKLSERKKIRQRRMQAREKHKQEQEAAKRNEEEVKEDEEAEEREEARQRELKKEKKEKEKKKDEDNEDL